MYVCVCVCVTTAGMIPAWFSCYSQAAFNASSPGSSACKELGHRLCAIRVGLPVPLGTPQPSTRICWRHYSMENMQIRSKTFWPSADIQKHAGPRCCEGFIFSCTQV